MRAHWPVVPAVLCLAFATDLRAAGFLEDSRANVDFRNLYFDRDFRQPGGNQTNGQSQAREWGQAIALTLQSGFTQGALGVGVDVIAMTGLNLDSSRDRAGSGMFPTERDGSSVAEFSRLGASVKLKYSETLVRSGVMAFRKPVLQSADSRLLPGLFKATTLESSELAGLTLQAARVTQVMGLDSSDWERLTSRYGGRSDEFTLYGADYALTEKSQVRAYYGKLDGIYQHTLVNYLGRLDFTADRHLSFDLRWAKAAEAEDFRNIDNRAFGALVGYREKNHTLSVGYQKMSGSDAYPYVTGTDPYLVNFVQILQFSNAGERSWQVRYDVDLAAWGVPGLSFMTRYVRGDQVQLSSGGDGREWERNSEFTYVIQGGSWKNASIKWRNATVRSSFGNDIDENRLIISYPLSLF
ncbi:OprD family porin [Pseudomonas capeferrum]|uniref:OprD family porin n=1 Tax=Pseudomonas capeferrum TaxID=1495066 RepID=UPI00397A29A3